MLNVHTSRDIAGDAADCPSWGRKIKEERGEIEVAPPIASASRVCASEPLSVT